MQTAERLYENLDTDELELQYKGKGSEYFLLVLKNILLNVLTFGIYSCWAKVNVIQYHSKNTFLQNEAFSFTGTGKEILMGRAKLIALLLLFVVVPTLAVAVMNSQLAELVWNVFFVLGFALITPFALLGAFKYKMTRTSWLGNPFKVTYINKKSFIAKYFLYSFLIPLSMGLLAPKLLKHIVDYMMNSVSYGNHKFEIDSDNSNLYKYSIGLFLSGIVVLVGVFSLFYSLTPLIQVWAEAIRQGATPEEAFGVLMAAQQAAVSNTPTVAVGAMTGLLAVGLGYMGFIFFSGLNYMESMKTFLHGLRVDNAEVQVLWRKRDTILNYIFVFLLSITVVGIPFAVIYFRRYMAEHTHVFGHIDTRQFVAADKKKEGVLSETFSDFNDLDFGAL